MSGLEKGPRGLRRGRGAKERILDAARQLFRGQGINNTGMDELCAVAQVSKRTAYQHFGSKDELITEYLRREDPDVMPDVFDRTDLSPRAQLLAPFQIPRTPDHTICPFIDAAVELPDPEHPARLLARDYKRSVAARLTAAARDAGAEQPEALGEQLALLLDGTSARTRTLGTDTDPVAADIAKILIDRALPEAPAASGPDRRSSRR